MDVNLSELMAALPEDDPSSAANADWAQEQLREILADLAQRPAPVGSLHRLWTLSELSAQIALAYLALWTRQWFSDAEASKRRLMETNLRMGLKTFHRLGYLRGAMTKLGQAAGTSALPPSGRSARRQAKPGSARGQPAGHSARPGAGAPGPPPLRGPAD